MNSSELPSYSKFVFGFSLWWAIGAALGMTGVSGIGATLLVVYWTGIGTAPTIDELITAGAGYVMATFWALSFVVMIFVQNEKWIELVRKPAQQQPRQAPRPIVATHVMEMAHNAKNYAIGQREFLPPSDLHYKELYHSLRNNSWNITRRALNVKVADIPAFANITEKYAAIVAHWQALEWVTDGRLNEAGQAAFIDLGHVR